MKLMPHNIIIENENMDEWEDKCRRKIAIRDDATMIFGPLSDESFRKALFEHGVIASVDGEFENWSKLLDISIAAESIRRKLGFTDHGYINLPTET